jgi:tetratricopeptide (TPR) repeat protein
LNAIARIDGLRVPGRTSSFYFKGKSVKLADIGRELSVGTVLQGSLRKEGNRVRITAQLVRIADETYLWSESYDRELNGIFAVQDEIAKAVVEALKVKLVQRSPGAPAGARTWNPEAYKHFLLGRHFQDHVSKQGTLLAEAEFRKAIALDPNYALAYAFLANSFGDQDLVNVPLTPEHSRLLMRRSMDEAERAVALGPELSVAYSARAFARMRAWQWSGATSDIKQALALNASDPVGLRRHGQLLGCIGRFDEAIAALQRSVDLDPLLPTSWSWLGSLYIAVGKLDLARPATERALRIAPAYDNGRADVAFLALLEGKPQAALELALQVEDQDVQLGIVARAEYDLRHDAASTKAIQELAKKVGQVHPSVVAEAYAWRGEYDAAFEWFERAVQQRDSFLFTLKLDPTRGLRRDPRWPSLLGKMNLPVE